MTLDRATFEQARNELVLRRAAIDRLIDAFDVLLADDELMSPRIVVTHPEPVAAVPATRQIAQSAPKVEPGEWADRRARAQTMYMQGTGPQEISDTLHVSIRRVDKWIQRGKWREQKVAILRGQSPEETPSVPDDVQPETHSEYDPEAAKKAETMFVAGDKCADIARALNRPLATIYTWSSKGKWRDKRETHVKANPPTTATTPVENDETVERLRARRKAADDQIIQEVKAQVDARDWSGLSGGAFSRGNGGAFE